MEPLQRLLALAPLFTVVLARVAGLMLSAPVLSSQDIPLRAKAGLAIAFAIALFPAALAGTPHPPRALIQCLPLIGSELLVGLAMGFGARVVISSFQIAGEVMGYQVGLAMAAEIAPDMESEATITSVLMHLLAMAGFLVLDVHHLLFRGLAATYTGVGQGVAGATAPLARMITDLFSAAFTDGLMAAAPCLAAMMVLTFAMGLLAKAVPRIPILMVGYPARILVGIFILASTGMLVWPVATQGFIRLSGYVGLLARSM